MAVKRVTKRREAAANAAAANTAPEEVEKKEPEVAKQPVAAIPPSLKKMTNTSKAAAVLIALGSDSASEVIKHLHESEIEVLSAEIAKIQQLSSDENDAIIYNIVTVPEDISKTSINLKAPLIINTKNNKACQVILENEKYKFKHIIMEEFK